MKILEEVLPGAYLLQPTIFADDRGALVKTYHSGVYESLGIKLDVQEEYFSISQKGVLRGMHFQRPPHAHDKFVYCITGRLLDVIVDLRVGSPCYGQCVGMELSGENRHCLFVPKGFAHGFYALSDGVIILYKGSAVYAPDSDGGIRWDSFGFNWPVADPMLSDKDAHLPLLKEFISPFVY